MRGETLGARETLFWPISRTPSFPFRSSAPSILLSLRPCNLLSPLPRPRRSSLPSPSHRGEPSQCEIRQPLLKLTPLRCHRSSLARHRHASVSQIRDNRSFKLAFGSSAVAPAHRSLFNGRRFVLFRLGMLFRAEYYRDFGSDVI